MARTVNPEAHALRRDAFVDAAIRRIQQSGYEQLSIQAVIDDVGASKGAFFHYFDSKAALLGAVVDRMVDEATRAVAPVADDPALTALEKLEAIFSGIAQWKRAQPELRREAVAELLGTWYSDENTIVVERMRSAARARFMPLFAAILRQGVMDGTFAVTDPDGTATVVTSLVLAMNDTAIRLFLGRLDGSVSYETVRCTLASFGEALERILGIPAGSWPIADESTVRYWFA